MQLRSLILAILCTLAVVLPARAHHSHARFDNSQWRVIDGTVQRVHLVNPHSWIYVEVTDEKGQVEMVALEATNPNSIQQAGIARDHVQSGDRIHVRCHPTRDGATSVCLLGFVTPMHGDMARGHGVERAWN